MSKIKGQNFRAFMPSAVIEATNCVCTLIGNTEDITTKDDAGLYGKNTVVSKGFSIQVDSFDISQLPALIRAQKLGKVEVFFDETAGAQNRNYKNASFNRHGWAYISSITANFNDRANSTLSVQFQGTGELTKQTDNEEGGGE